MSDYAETLHEAARIVAAKGAVHMPELIELLKPFSPGPDVTAKLEAQLKQIVTEADAIQAVEPQAAAQQATVEALMPKVPRR